MEGAIFGLVGVIVGGLLSWGTQFYFEWRKDRRAVSRAKRLIAGELLHAMLLLRSMYKSKHWPDIPDPTTVLPNSAWKEHRALLADKLNEGVWDELVMTYAEVEIDRIRLSTMGKRAPDGSMNDVEIKLMRTMVGKLQASRLALGAGGGWIDDLSEVIAEQQRESQWLTKGPAC